VIGAAGAMDWESAILWFVALVVSTTFHEAAHALFAKLGGDLTAYRAGQVSLNPLPHIQREPFGMVILPLLVLWGSGGTSCLGFASTPIDPVWAYHHPRRAALMSAAGPLANLALAAVALGVLVWVGVPQSGEGTAVHRIAEVFLFLNVLLFVFNLLPLPPLDGAGVVEGLLPALRRAYDLYRRQPMLGFVTFIVASRVAPQLYQPLIRHLRHLY